MSFSRNVNRIAEDHQNSLFIEPLEERVMLSTVEIFAAGFDGSENMRLRVDNAYAAGWDNIGGDVETRQFESYVYQTEQDITIDQIKVVFLNHDFEENDPDRNLMIDAVVLDGIRYETEHPSVFSTGTYRPEDGVQPGFRESEILHARGYFQYAEVPGEIIITANGDTGFENMSLLIDGRLVRSWQDIGTTPQQFSYVVNGPIDPEQVRIEFDNDDEFTNIDLNLNVDSIAIDGIIFETEAPGVFSTGTYRPEDGIVPGFRQSEKLHGNGYFQYSDQDPLPGQGASTVGFNFGDDIVAEDAGVYVGTVVRTGELSAPAWVEFETQDNIGIAGVDFVAAQGRVNFAADQTSATFEIALIDNDVDEIDRPFKIVLYNSSVGAVIGAELLDLAIVDDDLSPPSGTFVFEGHQYLLTSDLATWDEAQIEAASLGGNLVTPNSQVEQNWLNSTFGTTTPLWIGLTDRVTDGDFVWASGENETYRFWGSDQPDNLNGVEDFVAANLYANGRWGDFDSEIKFRGIVEISDDAPAQPNGTGFSTESIVSDLDQPTSFAMAGDGRIFVAEKSGIVKVIDNGVVTTFIDLRDEVNSHHDRGLLALELDPDFDNNGRVYLNYSVELNPDFPDEPRFETPSGGALIRVDETTPGSSVADLNSIVVLLDGHVTNVATHSVGDIAFDLNGNLVFTWADGGFSDDLRLATQDLDSLQGKLFRIDPETGLGVAENPLYDSANPDSVQSKLMAIGLRNSWRMSVDSLTGDIYLGEVTDSGPEEVNVVRAGETDLLNFGWPYFQGDNPTTGFTPPVGFVYESPLIELAHVAANDAIAGFMVYRGDQYPEIYQGRYFFGNIAQSIIYTASLDGNFQQFMETGAIFTPADMLVSDDGFIYVLSLYGGEISRLVYTPTGGENLAPTGVITASITAGVGPLVVTFDASQSFDPDGEIVSYEWDFLSDGTIDFRNTTGTVTFPYAGKKRVRLFVTDDSGATSVARLEINVLSTDPNAGTNIALGKSAIQSSQTNNAEASRAVDGNTSGVFQDLSTTLTLRERNPFWELDLGQSYDISTIKLFNRTDAQGSRLTDYYVLVSDVPFSSGNLNAVLTDPGIFIYYNTGDAGPLDIISVGVTGRYVRVQLVSQSQLLSLSEVEVFE